ADKQGSGLDDGLCRLGQRMHPIQCRRRSGKPQGQGRGGNNGAPAPRSRGLRPLLESVCKSFAPKALLPHGGACLAPSVQSRGRVELPMEGMRDCRLLALDSHVDSIYDMRVYESRSRPFDWISMNISPAKHNPKLFVLDTNVILHDAGCIRNFEENDIAIPITVLEELDRFKKGHDDIHFQA